MRFARTRNSVRQKQAKDQFCPAIWLAGVVRSRNWFVRPQPVAKKPRLSHDGRRAGHTHELTKQSRDGYRGNDTHKRVLVIDVIHSINLLACIVSDPNQWRRLGWSTITMSATTICNSNTAHRAISSVRNGGSKDW